jgi:hypothetical protein
MWAQVQPTGPEEAAADAGLVGTAAVETGSGAYDERMHHHPSHRLVSLLLEEVKVAEESPHSCLAEVQRT